jgi:hypothetical protein
MSLTKRLPASIMGGDPFNQFRFLYRRELLWKLFDEEYCLNVMRACYEAGGRAFDLSFEINTRLFSRLKEEVGGDILGFGNPSWEQGVMLNGRYIQYSRDRIMRTLVERIFPRDIARLVEEELSHEAVLVFGYDRDAISLEDNEIADIYLDEGLFSKRLEIFSDCQYIMIGGADADWLVSLGREDIVLQMAQIVRKNGYIPMVLCQFPSIVVPKLEEARCDTDSYVVPLNKSWSWLTHDACIEVVRSVEKPIVAFMPFSSPELKDDPRSALDWLYGKIGVESILYGTSTVKNASRTPILAQQARDSSDANYNRN